MSEKTKVDEKKVASIALETPNVVAKKSVVVGGVTRVLTPIGISVKKVFNEETNKYSVPMYDPEGVRLTAFIKVEDTEDEAFSVNFTVFEEEAAMFEDYKQLLGYLEGRKMVFKHLHTVKNGAKLPYDLGEDEDKKQGMLWNGETFTAARSVEIL